MTRAEAIASLTEAERRAYDRLDAEPCLAGNLGMAYAGPKVKSSRKPQHYALLGGKVGKKLVALGLACWKTGSGGLGGWARL